MHNKKLRKTKYYNILYKSILSHLPKTLSQILFPVDANKKIKPKPEKSKHPNSQKRQERRSNEDTRDQQLTTKDTSCRRPLKKLLILM